MTILIPESFLPPPGTNWKKVLSTLEPGKKDAFLESFKGNSAVALLGDWFLEARREQFPPPSEWYIWLILAGRGFGKTWTGSNWLIEQHRRGLAENSAIIAATAADLRRYCLEGPSGILTIAPKAFRPVYQPSKTRIKWPNNTYTHLYTAEKPDRIRGANHDKAWCDELSYWIKPDYTWDMLMLTLRHGDDPQTVVTMTPRPILKVREFIDEARNGDGSVIITTGSTEDNRENLSDRFYQEIINMYAGTSLYRQEVLGEVLMDAEGALWNHELIETYRKSDYPRLDRIVVGIDPSTSGKKGADEAGIVVAGLGVDKCGYVLEDLSDRLSPDAWAQRAVAAYERWSANCIIAESNQGGEMVRSVINNINPTIPVILIHAMVGKVARAEPVAALYERRQVYHAGVFPRLEDEMCMFVPGELKDSPNRVDALVYVLTELMVKKKFFSGAWGRKVSGGKRAA